ncbi:solute carrier family 26 member 10-like [Protopterus annectens]|uniref:solute carrier family 26 member 10-like n=1 Tax=Protopterus annectens TaxID=7888 RepID=UPI001CFA2917|nr:solute carrier family 26 member 10-like [Protopterus annectens]
MSGITVYRKVYTEDQFKQAYGTLQQKASISETLKKKLQTGCCSSKDLLLKVVKKRVPLFTWLPKYKLRKWLLGDVIAGVTVGVLHIPQGMAFALLTSVAPIYGLYTSFFPVILYMLFGTGRHVSTGTFAVVSLMTGSIVERLVPHPVDLNLTVSEQDIIEQQRIGIAAAAAFLMGLLMVCMFTLQLGFLATYLSDPIVKAFTNGAAFHVTVSQIQNMLGLKIPRFTGPFTLFKTLAAVFEGLPLTNVAELAISFACLTVLIPMKEINTRFKHKLRTPLPVEILMVIAATGITFASSLETQYAVEIVGRIPAGFPSPKLPALESIPSLVGDTIAVTFVGYAVSVSLAMIYAEKHRYTIDPNQELLAHGISNTVSSFFNCFPSSAAMATTNILDSAGGYTQLSGLFTSLVVLIVLLAIGPLFYYLPKAVLACINVTSLRQMFIQFQDLPELWRVSKTDFMVWLVTWLAVVTLNVDLGLAVGVIFSMMTVIFRTQRAGCSVLGRASNTEIYRPVDTNTKCYEIAGVKILAYNAPIYYGNRNFFRDAMSGLVGITQEKIKKREKALKAARKISIETTENGIANLAYLSDNDMYTPDIDGEEIQCLIIDCSSVIFIDAAGARLFIQMCIECHKCGICVYLAHCNNNIMRTLTSSGIMNHLSPEQIFVTVHDAVVHIQQNKETSAQKSATVWV